MTKTKRLDTDQNARSTILIQRPTKVSFIRKGIIQLVILVLGSVVALAQCDGKPQTLRHPTSRSNAEHLQQGVNEGHEPWLLDSRAVADYEINRLDEKYKDGSYVVFSRVVSADEQLAIFEYELPNKAKHYIITVKRFQWLLPISKKLAWTIWSLKEIQITNCITPEKE